MQKSGAVRAPDIAALDVGGAAGAGDEDGVAGLGLSRHARRIVFEMRQQAAFLEHDDVVQRQEGQQDRRIRPGVDDQRPGLGDAPEGKPQGGRLVRRDGVMGVYVRPVQSGERQARSSVGRGISTGQTSAQRPFMVQAWGRSRDCASPSRTGVSTAPMGPG